MVKQKDLFGYNYAPEETDTVSSSNVREIVLDKPSQELFDKTSFNVDMYFTSDELTNIISSDTFRYLYKNTTVYEYDHKNDKKELSLIVNKMKSVKNPSKKDKVNFLALFLSSQKNLQIYYDSLPEGVKKVWKAVYENNFITCSKASMLLGCQALNSSGYYGSRSYLIPELAMFKYFRGKSGHSDTMNYSYYNDYIYLRHFLYVPFYLVVNSDKFSNHHRYSTLPAKEKLKVFYGEQAISQEFQLLLSFYKQGTFSLGNSKKVSVMTVRKLARQIGLVEFFPESEDKDMYNMRATLLINFFAYYMENLKSVRKKEVMEVLIKDLISNIEKSLTIQTTCLLPHIGGVKYNYLSETGLTNLNIFILSFFKNHKEDAWFYIDELIDSLKFVSGGKATVLFDGFVFDTMNLNNKRTGHILGYEDLDKQVGRAFIKAYVAMLSSFGLLDIAYCDYNYKDVSCFEWVRYFKLTNLGRYVFGQTDEYVSGFGINNKKYFELDQDRLIIRSLEENNPYEQLLLDISEPIGNNRYKLTNASFLRNCKNVSELSDKIDFFKQFISDKWSKVWEDFFTSIKMKCKPLDKVASDDYLIYKLSPENKELIQVMLSDNMIKSNIIKAEGYLILIKKNDKRKVFERLKQLGYMM